MRLLRSLLASLLLVSLSGLISQAQDKAVKTQPAPTQSPVLSKSQQRELARVQFEKTLTAFVQDKNRKTARAGFLKAIVLDPSFAPPYFNLGVVCEADEDWAAAEKWFQAFAKLDPKSSYAAKAMAEIAQIASIRSLTATPEGKKKFHYDEAIRRARLFLNAKLPKEAVAEASQAVQIDSTRWEAYAVAADALAQDGQGEQARHYLAMAVARAPESKQRELEKGLDPPVAPAGNNIRPGDQR